MGDESILERGRRVRAEVITETASPPNETPDALLEPFHELGLAFAWGTIWSRDGVSIKTRRFVTIALLAAQGRPRELAMHMRAALAHGCTAEELREVCMHVTCYCGFPAAADALRTLSEVIASRQDA